MRKGIGVRGKFKAFILFFNIFALNLLFISNVCAGIGAYPTVIETSVSSNSEEKGVITVVNEDDEAVRVKVEVEDWLKAKTGVSAISLDKWLKISPMEFDLAPKGVREVEYTIASPAAGYRGELIAMIFFSAPPTKKGAFGIMTRFGVCVYAGVKDGMVLGCDLKNIAIQKTDKGIAFGLDIENKGNVHIRPTGNIVVTDENGVMYNVLIERNFPIYPGKQMSQVVVWNKTDLAPGKYEFQINLDYGNIYNVDNVLVKKKTFTVNSDGSISS